MSVDTVMVHRSAFLLFIYEPLRLIQQRALLLPLYVFESACGFTLDAPLVNRPDDIAHHMKIAHTAFLTAPNELMTFTV